MCEALDSNSCATEEQKGVDESQAINVMCMTDTIFLRPLDLNLEPLGFCGRAFIMNPGCGCQGLEEKSD